MPTNVIVISDDVNKSEVLGEFIANALEKGGFTEVNQKFTVGFMQSDPELIPVLKKLGLENDDKSALDIIQNAYPNFLSEAIDVRAIKVEDLDVNGFDDDDHDHAYESRESAKISRSGNENMTSVFIYEDRPKKIKPAEQREQEALKRRSMMTNILAGEDIVTAVEDM
jgi:hypothetical protein